MNISDKVICVDDSNIEDGVFPNGKIVKGETYCVNEVNANYTGVRIVGKPCWRVDNPLLGWWKASRFRTIESLRTEQVLINFLTK